MSNYNKNLDKNNANYVPLTPLSFLERTKDIYPNYEAIIYEVGNIHGKRCMRDALNLLVH